METTETQTEKKELISFADYRKELANHLPKDILKRDPWRLKWAIFFYGVIGSCIYLVMSAELPIVVKVILGLIMGICSGGATFLAHEILHGSVVKSKKLQSFFGFFGFAPFLISPTYWRFWHNYLHHGNTQLLYKDPDAFPTKMVWKKSKFMQRVFKLAPGSGYLRSYFYFFYWFSLQAFLNQVYMRFGNKMWAKMNHKAVTVEFILQCLMMGAYCYFVGASNLIYLVLIPFLIQNYTVMSYISTNHNISPYTKVNDPLVNSLTVTNNPILEKVHMNFGYHTEHHLFPNAPMTKAKLISNKLKELYPDRYMIMPKGEAMKKLYSTPRIYKNRETLINPETDKEFGTLGHGLS